MFIRSNSKSALFLWKVSEMDVTIVEKFSKSFFGGPLFSQLRIYNAQSAPPCSVITAPEGGVLNAQRCKGMPPSAAYLGKVAFQDVRSRMSFRRSYNSKRRKFLGF